MPSDCGDFHLPLTKETSVRILEVLYETEYHYRGQWGRYARYLGIPLLAWLENRTTLRLFEAFLSLSCRSDDVPFNTIRCTSG